MKKLIFIALLFFATAIPAQSAEIDMNTFSCEEYSSQSQASKYNYVQWLDGYMSAASDASITGSQWINHLTNHLDSYCSSNPSNLLIEAASEVPSLNFEGEDKLDMSCASILAIPKSDPNYSGLFLWVDGYISVGGNDLVISTTSLGNIKEALNTFCSADASATLGDLLLD